MVERAADVVNMRLYGGRLKAFKWEGLLVGDSAAKLSMPHLADKSVQVIGTPGGATINVKGSLDSDVATAVFALLTNPAGDNLSFTVAGLDTILQNVYTLEIELVGGDGTTDLDVIVLGKGV